MLVNNGVCCNEAQQAQLGGISGTDPQDKDQPILQARQKSREGYASIHSIFPSYACYNP